MTHPSNPTAPDRLNRLFSPRSVVIVGVSTRPGSTGGTVLANLRSSGYPGEIHLVGSRPGTVDGLPILADISEVPHGVDLAILCVPADAVKTVVAACITRGIGAVLCYASGFAETGEAGRHAQDDLAVLAESHGIVLLGPNCVGFANYGKHVNLLMVPPNGTERYGDVPRPGAAVIAQSGGVGFSLAETLSVRGVPVTHLVTTGNEAQLSLGSLVDYMLEQPSVRVIAVYAEQIREPGHLVEAAREAARLGKSIVLLHPGRSARAKAAMGSHTGALIGDHAAMTAALEAQGVLVADTYENLLDQATLAASFSRPAGGGLGIVTSSGAMCALFSDYTDMEGVAIPALSKSSEHALAEILPSFISPANPLDVGTAVITQPELLARGVEELLGDDQIGAAIVSLAHSQGALAESWVKSFTEGAATSDKPCIFVEQSDGVPLDEGAAEIARNGGVVSLDSPERAVRALKTFLAWGARRPLEVPNDERPVPELGCGSHAEWRAKQVIADLGVAVPDGGLASDAESAVKIAERIGFPVVLKVQSSGLMHKTEIGGVLLNVADAAAVRDGFAELVARAERAGVAAAQLDGVLVETMARSGGVEIILGVRRDPDWGPILALGLGGVWVEALKDIRLIAADSSLETIVEELGRLKGARLLQGLRGSEPVDVHAVARAAVSLAELCRAAPEVLETEINPLLAYPDGALALDAVIVTAS